MAFRRGSIARCMRYSNIDERWGSLDLVMSGITLMTSKFLPAFQNLIALFLGNEQGRAGRVLRRAETTPLHRGSPQWLCLSRLAFGGLWVFSQPQEIWKLNLFSMHEVH